MTDKELMQQALEALEYPGNIYHRDCPKDAAITALRERLARCDDCGEANPADIHTCSPQRLAQPEQEPVAWRTFDGEGGYDYRDYDMNENYADEWAKRNPNHKGWVDALYTTSPRREWQGLTDEDMVMCESEEDVRFARAIEAKLKEKNA